MVVPADRLYGTYVASYPFGTDTITLSRDGTFIQQIAVRQEQTVTVHGKWDFDRKESRVGFDDALVIDDGFGHLRPDWRKPGIASLEVEEQWFRVVMNSGSAYPYLKR
jgi:hypothetical protein